MLLFYYLTLNINHDLLLSQVVSSVGKLRDTKVEHQRSARKKSQVQILETNISPPPQTLLIKKNHDLLLLL